MNPDLEDAIRRVEASAGGNRAPTRHDARPILLLVGEALLAGEDEAAIEARERLQRLPGKAREGWLAAVHDELEMACTEHVRSVDPRYLGHSSYDVEYTLQARRRLGWRIAAAEFLGAPLEPELAEAVDRADRLLAGHRPETRDVFDEISGNNG